MSSFEYFGADEVAKQGAMPTVQFPGFKGGLYIQIYMLVKHNDDVVV